MTAVIDIHNRFLDSIEESRVLFTYCRSPRALHSSAGVESAFLDAFKAWEVFLEEVVFAYLRGEQDKAGNIVPTTFSLHSYDMDLCVRIVNGGRRGFTDWANPERDVKPRLKTYFDPPLDSKLDPGLVELREMLICRNAIAHASGSAGRRLEDLWQRKTGLSRSALRSADVLLVEDPANPPLTWFERYLLVLEALSEELAEI